MMQIVSGGRVFNVSAEPRAIPGTDTAISVYDDTNSEVGVVVINDASEKGYVKIHQRPPSEIDYHEVVEMSLFDLVRYVTTFES